MDPSTEKDEITALPDPNLDAKFLDLEQQITVVEKLQSELDERVNILTSKLNEYSQNKDVKNLMRLM